LLKFYFLSFFFFSKQKILANNLNTMLLKCKKSFHLYVTRNTKITFISLLFNSANVTLSDAFIKKEKKIYQIMIITYNKSAVLALLLCLIKMYFLSEKKKIPLKIDRVKSHQKGPTERNEEQDSFQKIHIHQQHSTTHHSFRTLGSLKGETVTPSSYSWEFPSSSYHKIVCFHLDGVSYHVKTFQSSNPIVQSISYPLTERDNRE
jgi:hypothetical protein